MLGSLSPHTCMLQLASDTTIVNGIIAVFTLQHFRISFCGCILALTWSADDTTFAELIWWPPQIASLSTKVNTHSAGIVVNMKDSCRLSHYLLRVAKSSLHSGQIKNITDVWGIDIDNNPKKIVRKSQITGAHFAVFCHFTIVKPCLFIRAQLMGYTRFR